MPGLGAKDKQAPKTKSQAMRAVLYRLWEKDDKGFEEFDPYYDWAMDHLIQFLQKKLD